AARDYNPMYGLANSAETTALTWLYFGDAAFVPYPHVLRKPFLHWNATLHFALSNYKMPDIIKRIATDRDQAFVHREFMKKNPMEPKEYCYISPTYGMASIVGENGKIVPDVTRWKVQWVTKNKEEEPSVFFLKHPHDTDEWLKWRGASPAEQVIQYKNVLLAVYKIDEDKKPFIDGPFTPASFELLKQKDGWFFIHTGSCLLAVKAVNGLEMTDEKRVTDNHGIVQELGVLKSEGRRNGLIVQTASLDDYESGNVEESLNKFISDVLKKTKVNASGINSDNPQLTYRSLSGDLIEIAFDKFKRVNGKNLDLENWPLLGNPWMHQEIKGHILVLQHNGKKRVYDFEKWTVEDSNIYSEK
ncbi:MAG: hypothetical protein GZ094_24005, partial [Mariniphaga sp.]|nr:hypothetical protein [Mariniphaga sp.]